MKYRTLRLKRVWIPALVVAVFGVGGWAWAVWGRTYADPSDLPYTVGQASIESHHFAPAYGTRVRFAASPQAAFARARREDKPVLLLHLSGRFESSDMT